MVVFNHKLGEREGQNTRVRSRTGKSVTMPKRITRSTAALPGRASKPRPVPPASSAPPVPHLVEHPASWNAWPCLAPCCVPPPHDLTIPYPYHNAIVFIAGAPCPRSIGKPTRSKNHAHDQARILQEVIHSKKLARSLITQDLCQPTCGRGWGSPKYL